MTELNIALTLAGATVIVLGLVSNAIRPTILQEPLVAFIAGVIAGPAALGILDLSGSPHLLKIVEEAARLTLAIGLMGVALRLRHRDLLQLWRPVVLLLAAGMLGMWLASTAAILLALGVPLLLALVVGAAVTPTDPVVASSIVTGRFAESLLPEHLRATLSIESGANDGLAYAILLLPVLLLQRAPGAALHEWLVQTLLVGVAVGICAGAAIGYAAGRAFHWARETGLMEEYSLLTFSVALSLFTLGAVSVIGSDGILGVFAAGLAFNLTTDTEERHEEENVQEGVGKLFLLPIFVLFGAVLPWVGWHRLGWAGVALAGLVLLLRRLPVLLAISPWLRGRYSRPDLAFLGWFGPIGVAAIYYAVRAVHETGEIVIWHATSLIVAASLLAHGLSAAPLTRLYAAGSERRAQG